MQKDESLNKNINCINCSENMAYIVNNRELFSFTGYKILKSQEQKGFIRCEKLLYNGELKLVYFTSRYKSLSNLLGSLKNYELLKLMGKLVEAVSMIKNNGFLLCQNLDLSLERIFVDEHTREIYLIYLPLNNMNEGSGNEFESDFKLLLNMLITVENGFSPLWIDYLKGILKEASLHDLAQQFYIESDALLNKKHIPMNKTRPMLTLALKDSPKDVYFNIEQDEYLIGKNAAVVDGVITFNSAISRKHCKIVYHDEQYFVVDLGSVNGSYINGLRLVPEEEYKVQHGEVLRLANTDFFIEIEGE